jgi:hydrogenase maturation protease
VSASDGPLLVLGIGNVLLRDEGVGVQVIRELEALAERGELELPPDTELLDGGTLGLDLLPRISDARALLLVDAIDLRDEPGTMRILRGPDIQGALSGHVSPHQVGIGDLIAAARLMGTLPDAVILVGVQPLEIAVGLELSPPVLAALPRAVDAAIGAIAELGRSDPGAADPDPTMAGAVPTAATG